jgi:glycine cleavage system aminomethyltransferase T
MAAKQSGFAKTNQLIIRRDIVGLAAFSIIGARSLGEYLWHTVIEAGCEWDITLIGQSALNTLQEQSSK